MSDSLKMPGIHPSIYPPSITLTRKHWVVKKLLYVAAELIEKLKWQLLSGCCQLIKMTLGGVRGGVCFGGQKEKKEKSKEKLITILMMSQLQMQPDNLV